MKFSFYKLLNWEYWPSSLFYIPNLPYAFYLAIKARSAGFFYAANPCIKGSGNGTESKYATIELIPKELRPKSILIEPSTNLKKVLEKIHQQKIDFPLIVKPDLGFRGLLVKKIHSKIELECYLKQYPLKVIVQEFLDYPLECGIFYHRKPNKNKGTISSITLKKFLSITGDGKSTLEKLIKDKKRAYLHYTEIEKRYKKNLKVIYPKGENIRLSVIGNHSKGTEFINGNHLISEKLTQVFDDLSASIHGWYYGRVDVKYNSFEELENGLGFKIIEINGIISEPTHIYDSTKGSYLKSLQAIRRHWNILFKISKINHKKHNIPYGDFKDLIKNLLLIKKIRKEALSFLKK